MMWGTRWAALFGWQGLKCMTLTNSAQTHEFGDPSSCDSSLCCLLTPELLLCWGGRGIRLQAAGARDCVGRQRRDVWAWTVIRSCQSVFCLSHCIEASFAAEAVRCRSPGRANTRNINRERTRLLAGCIAIQLQLWGCCTGISSGVESPVWIRLVSQLDNPLASEDCPAFPASQSFLSWCKENQSIAGQWAPWSLLQIPAIMHSQQNQNTSPFLWNLHFQLKNSSPGNNSRNPNLILWNLHFLLENCFPRSKFSGSLSVPAPFPKLWLRSTAHTYSPRHFICIKDLKYIWIVFFFSEIEKYFICTETNHPK